METQTPPPPGPAQPTPPTPPQGTTVQPKVEGQPSNLKKLGYWSLLAMSFKLLFKNILQFIKLTIALLAPILLIASLLFWWASDQGAQAAPAVPSAGERIIEESTVDAEGLNKEPTERSIGEIVEAIDAEQETVDNGESNIGLVETDEVEPSDQMAEDELVNMRNQLITEQLMREMGSPSSRLKWALEGTALGATFAVLMGIMAILMIPFVLYQAYAALAFIRLTVLISQEQTIAIGEILKWSFKKIGSYILLVLRIFIYTFAWIPLITSYVAPFFSYGDAIPIIIMFIDIAAFLILVVRGPRTLFSYYILAEKECTSKEALQESIKVSLGNWRTIISYWVSMIIMIQLLGIIGFFALSSVHVLLGGIALGIFVAIGFYVTFIFMYALYNYVKLMVPPEQPKA